jgi:hypothetical protein
MHKAIVQGVGIGLAGDGTLRTGMDSSYQSQTTTIKANGKQAWTETARIYWKLLERVESIC